MKPTSRRDSPRPRLAAHLALALAVSVGTASFVLARGEMVTDEARASTAAAAAQSDLVPAADTPPPAPGTYVPLEDDDAAHGLFDTPAAVIDFVRQRLPGATWEWGTAGVNVVVVRKHGSGYQPGGSAEAPYDDLILAVSRETVWAYSRGNAEGTANEARRQQYGYTGYDDPYLERPATPALAPGAYRICVDKHQGEYRALFVYGMDYARVGLKSQRLNGKYGAWKVGAVNLHLGGDAWNYSVGCLTLHYSQWDAFIARFPKEGDWGRLYLVGDYRTGYRDYNLRALSVTPGGVGETPQGSCFRVAAKLENQASLPLGPFAVGLWVGDEFYRRQVPKLPAQSAVTLAFDTKVPASAPGTYPCSLVVDCLAQIEEFDEDDNALPAVALNLARGANLAPLGLGDPQPPQSGGGYVVTATVANRGAQDVGAEFGLTVTLDGGTYPSRLPGPAAGGATSIALRTTVAKAGAYPYAMVADGSDEVVEENEGDNELRGILILPAGDFTGALTVAVDGHAGAAAEVVVGRPVTFSGTATGGIGWLEASVDGWPLAKLEPAPDGTFAFTYTFGGAGRGRRLLVTAHDRPGDGRRFLTGVVTTVDVLDAR